MSLEAMKRIKSLLQDTDKIDSHTISAVVAECDMVILTQQPATGEPVVDVRCEGCGYMTHHREHMGCVRAAKQHTHQAPSVPEDVQRDAERLNDLESLVKSKGMHGLSFDYCRHVEDGYVVEKGFRLMWRHTLCERKPTLREAIDAAMLAAKDAP